MSPAAKEGNNRKPSQIVSHNVVDQSLSNEPHGKGTEPRKLAITQTKIIRGEVMEFVAHLKHHYRLEMYKDSSIGPWNSSIGPETKIIRGEVMEFVAHLKHHYRMEMYKDSSIGPWNSCSCHFCHRKPFEVEAVSLYQKEDERDAIYGFSFMKFVLNFNCLKSGTIPVTLRILFRFTKWNPVLLRSSSAIYVDPMVQILCTIVQSVSSA
nr:uncharacterized protein LOC113706485 isoform X2 [Coffea arabica]